MELLEDILHLFAEFFGWLLRRFRRWLDRLPDRDPSQISPLERFGRLALGVSLTVCILLPLRWLIFR
jgi:hypothetical protein